MLNILLIIHIIISILLILIILIQKTSTDTITSSTVNNLGTNINTSNLFLVKTTIVLATLFIVNSIILANLSTRKIQEKSIIENISKPLNNKEQTTIPIK